MLETTITFELGSRLFELTPEKPKRFLEKALRRGLTVRLHGTTTDATGWTIESTNPIDDWQLWLYFQPGARGGKLTISRYTPTTTTRSNTKKLTQREASITIDDMGDALDRHNAREADKARRDAHAADLDAAVATRPALDTVPASDVDSETFAQAVTLAASLKANGLFAIRVAHRGAIPRNTPGKVRAALVNRGLAHVAGGTLTDLGRAVRSLIIA